MRIPVAEPSVGKEELSNVKAAVESGWVSSLGGFIHDFESGFARYCGVKHGISTCNGTTALHLALAALGIGRGDEVLIPSLTFVATANAVAYTGAVPVFVDCHPEYLCINPDEIESRITPRTKAVIPVHLYGHPCDMNPIVELARAHNLHVVEDAAEAHGAEYRLQKVGSFGHVACFSFFGNKIITTGEGGMCLTSDDDLAERMRILRDHGTTPGKPYWHDVRGFNYRMTNLQAALGVAQLRKIDRFIKKRRQLANWYTSALGELSAEGAVRLPTIMPWAKSVCWMYYILLNDEYGVSRDELVIKMGDREIETRPFFYPVQYMPMYRSDSSAPVAEDVSSRGICLPCSVKMTREHVDFIVRAIVEIRP